MTFDALGILLLLIGLELVLGIDNILVITILVARLPKEKQQKARIIGLAGAMGARILMLGLIVYLSQIEQEIIWGLSVRDIILLAGGAFLLYKAVKEIHHTVELKDEHDAKVGKAASTMSSIVTQIILLDVVFSIDSVITAIGLTENIIVIIAAVILSFTAILFAARPVGEFINKHPALKILALAFLITIGVTIFMEGMHHEMPKAYIYLPMGFALFVELLQMRYQKNREKLKGE
jgi:predicted tellurium resistance membrane protein TerC